MAITPRTTVSAVTSTPPTDSETPFNNTLGVVDVAEDLVLVPATKRGRTIDIVNEGPGDVAVKLDGTAVVTSTLLREGDSVSWVGLDIQTKVSFINVTAASLPVLRGVLHSGPVS